MGIIIGKMLKQYQTVVFATTNFLDVLFVNVIFIDWKNDGLFSKSSAISTFSSIPFKRNGIEIISVKTATTIAIVKYSLLATGIAAVSGTKSVINIIGISELKIKATTVNPFIIKLVEAFCFTFGNISGKSAFTLTSNIV